MGEQHDRLREAITEVLELADRCAAAALADMRRQATTGSSTAAPVSGGEVGRPTEDTGIRGVRPPPELLRALQDAADLIDEAATTYSAALERAIRNHQPAP